MTNMTIELTAKARETFGKTNKVLRDKGFIPAELYGHGLQNLHLAVDAKDFKKVFKEAGENTVVNLVIGSEKRPAIIHDVQKNYLDESVNHIDFYQVRMDEKVKAHIPIEIIGEAPAVKEKGGVLNRTLSDIEVEALPGDLPHNITVDIGVLIDLNQSIYIKDIQISKSVKVILDPDTVIVSVTPLKEEEVVSAPVDVADVKVEGEEKKAERDKEKEGNEAE
jgi:large subunit ribosomal protein L25